MSEVTDLIMPVLQSIQTRLGAIERDVASIKQTVEEHSAKFDDLEIYSAYETGLETQNRIDIKRLRSRIKTVEDRQPRP